MYVTKQEIISGTLALDRISELYLLMRCSEKSTMTFSHSSKKKACSYCYKKFSVTTKDKVLVHFNPKVVSSHHSLASGL